MKRLHMTASVFVLLSGLGVALAQVWPIYSWFWRLGPDGQQTNANQLLTDNCGAKAGLISPDPGSDPWISTGHSVWSQNSHLLCATEYDDFEPLGTVVIDDAGSVPSRNVSLAASETRKFAVWGECDPASNDANVVVAYQELEVHEGDWTTTTLTPAGHHSYRQQGSVTVQMHNESSYVYVACVDSFHDAGQGVERLRLVVHRSTDNGDNWSEPYVVRTLTLEQGRNPGHFPY